MKHEFKNLLSESLLDLLEEYSPDFFYIADFPASNYLYMSDSVSDYLGLCPGRLCTEDGMDFCHSLIHPYDLETNMGAYFEKLTNFKRPDFERKTPPSFTIEYRIKNAKGQYIWMQSRDYVIGYTEDDKVKYTLGMATCIEDKEAKEEFVLTDLSLKEIVKGFYPKYSERKKAISSVSARELEVIELLTEGLSSKMIACKLYISPETVETHRKNILKKLDVKNTAQLIKLIYQYKLLKPGFQKQS